MTKEKEKQFLLLLSSYFLKEGATKSAVLDTIANNNWAYFSDEQLQEKSNRKELVWRNDFAFVRKHLVQNGLYVEGIRNNWSITEQGIIELRHLYTEVSSEKDFIYITLKAKTDAQHILYD